MSLAYEPVEYVSLTRQWMNTYNAMHPLDADAWKEKWCIMLRRFDYLSAVRSNENYTANPMFELKAFYDPAVDFEKQVVEDIMRIWEITLSRNLRAVHCWRDGMEDREFLFGGRTSDGTFVTGKLCLRPADVPTSSTANSSDEAVAT
ncbi:MAG: hypothetical protein JST40_00620 [Armatimonadetes bacterium]|nr:hypothetical protein [Armatimonadota bacterium]